MTEIIIAVLVIALVGSAIAAILFYAPFIPAPLKQWGMWAVGAVCVVLILLQLLKLAGVAA